MFIPVKSDVGGVLPWEYLPAAAGSYKAGQLVKVVEGKAAAISEAMTAMPAYLCMSDKVCQDGELLPVTRISMNHIYETTLAAAAEGTEIGDKLQVAAGGMSADAGAAGAFEVVSMEGTDQGDYIRGRWVN